MVLFERHIFRRLIGGYFLLIFLLTIFFIVMHYVEYIDDFLDRGATLSDVFLTYYPNYIPEIIKLISPLAIFMSAVYLTGKLAQELQLTALYSAGVSLYRLMRPYLLAGLLVSGLMFWFNGWVVPKTNIERLAFEDQYMNNKKTALKTSNLHRQNSRESVVRISFYDRRAQVGHRISMMMFTEEHHLTKRIDATSMTWVDSLSVWRLKNSIVRSFDLTGKETRVEINEMDTVLTLFPRDFARTENDVQMQTIAETRDYIEALKRAGADQLSRPLVDYYSKFSYPFANLVLLILGASISSVRRRGGQAAQLGLGLVVAFVYLSSIKLVEPFGYAGTLHPLVAAWSVHLAFVIIGIVALVTAKK